MYNPSPAVMEIDQQAPCIMIVDDQLENLLLLEDMLADSYQVQSFQDGRQALDYLAQHGHADLILLDVLMPGLDGFEICRQLKLNPATTDIPVLFLTSLDSESDETRGLTLGAEDFIRKPLSPPVVQARLRTHLKLHHAHQLLRDRNQQLEYQVAQRTRKIIDQSQQLVHNKQQLIAAQTATITAFCTLAEQRDNETGNHILRTQHYVRILAEELQSHPRFREHLNEESIEQLFKSAPLHDIGKVAIPDAILLKPGALSDEEWSMMRRHCEFGYRAIINAEQALPADESSFLRYAKEIAYSHHERWDGSGYPQGLSGEAIPFAARLMAVADVYDALISERVYKKAMSHEQAVTIIAEGSGSHFDPDVAGAMLSSEAAFKEIAMHFSDKNDIANNNSKPGL